MNLMSILASISAFIPYELFDLPAYMERVGVSSNFIVKYIDWLISWSSVGIGVILFTLTLRLIVLPFDIFSKVKTKKNAVKMEAMRGDLEKLQRQYAGDKQLYNQKMLALQKKNGYSPLAGCLPMILSLVIFFVAIDAFRSYSAIAISDEYNDIVSCYNTYAENVTVNRDPSLWQANKDGEKLISVDIDTIYFYNNIDDIYPEFSGIKETLVLAKTPENADYLTVSLDDDSCFSVAASSFIKLFLPTEEDFSNKIDTATYGLTPKDDGRLFFDVKDAKDKQAYIDGFAAHLMEKAVAAYWNKNIVPEINENVKRSYENGEIKKSTFLWVKNIWIPDVSYQHPISDIEGLKNSISGGLRKSCSCAALDPVPISEETYLAVTAGLSEQKQQANGYFIMVILSIGTMFLSQFIMTKMQKAQMELQTVDGQAAMTQKMMMWMMPIVFGVFAFSYSTAFSIYMTVSSVVSTLSSVVINIFVERKYGSNKPAAVEAGRSMKNVNRIRNERLAAEEEAEKKAREKAEKKAEKAKKKK